MLPDFTSTFLLIKWNNEDCWDVVHVSEAGFKEYDDVTSVQGQLKEIKFQNKIFEAIILETGVRKDMERKCQQLVKEFIEKSADGRRIPVPNRKFLNNSDEEKTKRTEVEPPQKKKRKTDQQHQFLNHLQKKILGENNDVCSKCRNQVSALQVKISSLEAELKSFRDLSHMIEKTKILQTQAKSILKHSKRIRQTEQFESGENFCQASASNANVAQTTLPNNFSQKVELIEGSGVFIETRKLKNICADAGGDGKKLARNLLASLYLPEELASHSMTGKQSNAFKNLKECKPAIDKTRLNTTLQYVRNETTTDISKVKASISNKIKEVTKFFEKQNNSV